MLKLEDKVKLKTFSLKPENDEPNLNGTVAGFGTVGTMAMVLVRMEQGFYDPTNSIFTSILVVHETNLDYR
jgi:hypothetical protein